MATTASRLGTGRIIVLNGVPRSGKSSIAGALQALAPTPMMNLGVDAMMASTPAGYLPGIGLRPGGERPDLEPFVRQSYLALFDSMAAHGRHGISVVSDVGLHDGYSQPMGLWSEAAQRLAGLPVWVVGVRCAIEQILQRRAAEPGRYDVAVDGSPPATVIRWEDAVHDPGWYDLEVDTSDRSATDCAQAVLAHVGTDSPRALDRHRQT